MIKTYEKSRAKQTFFWALAMAFIVFIPFVIFERGYFFFLGDFNVQQIPFYSLAHDAIRNGEVFWNWNTDLGANFLGSYSFYLLFSPFFWLTIPFPNSFVPYLIAPLLMLKTACAAFTGYLYIERFVRDKYYAMIGGILYAFSGFTIYNIFFNHFHEAIVFFPLLLIGVEELVTNNKRGLFAAAVAINCMVNYWFFIGEVIFVVLYVFVRMTSPQWQMSIRKFMWIVFESVLGVMIAMFALLPSVLAIMGNPRTGAENLLNGWNFWIYWADQRQGAILQNMFFPPDLPSQPNFFPEHSAKWSSMNAWLPMVSMSGVIAYLQSTKNSWLKKMLYSCLFIALIPGLNSLFVLFNHSYYARWFYMPVLLMSLATVLAFERRTTVDIKRGVKWTGIITLLFTLAIGLTPIEKDDKWSIGLSAYPARFWGYCAFAIIGVLLTYLLVSKMRRRPAFKKYLLTMISVFAVLFSWLYITIGKCYGDDGNFIRDTAIGMRRELITHKDSDEFVRTNIYKSMDNLGMYWQIPNIQAFHSVVPTSIMEFYPRVGIKRDVSSKPEVEYYALMSLLSVKWHYVPEAKDTGEADIYGFKLYGSQNGFNIYENENFLPMGFGYTKIIEADKLGDKITGESLLDTMVLEDFDTVERNKDIATPVNDVPYDRVTMEAFKENVEERERLSCYDFKIDDRGFTALSALDEDVMMLFSVPYEKGWKATINGEPVKVEKANIGFMAVRVPAGEVEIRFDFTPPGIKLGSIVSGVAIIILVLYMLYYRKKAKDIKTISSNIVEDRTLDIIATEEFKDTLEIPEEIMKIIEVETKVEDTQKDTIEEKSDETDE